MYALCTVCCYKQYRVVRNSFYYYLMQLVVPVALFYHGCRFHPSTVSGYFIFTLVWCFDFHVSSCRHHQWWCSPTESGPLVRIDIWHTTRVLLQDGGSGSCARNTASNNIWYIYIKQRFRRRGYRDTVDPSPAVIRSGRARVRR